MQLSDRALAICRAYWRKDAQGRVANDCCAGCPLFAPCNDRYGPGEAETYRRAAACNAAAATA